MPGRLQDDEHSVARHRTACRACAGSANLQLRYEPFPASRSLWMDAAIYQSMVETYPPLRPIPGDPEGRQPVLTPTLEKECRFDHVNFSHGDVPIVKNVSLSIEVGSITVLQGPSGAGKTTIVDLLIGLHKPDSGTISLDDVLLDDIDIRQWRRSIAYVPQELSLLHATIRHNLILGDQKISDSDILHA